MLGNYWRCGWLLEVSGAGQLLEVQAVAGSVGCWTIARGVGSFWRCGVLAKGVQQSLEVQRC